MTISDNLIARLNQRLLKISSPLAGVRQRRKGKGYFAQSLPCYLCFYDNDSGLHADHTGGDACATGYMRFSLEDMDNGWPLFGYFRTMTVCYAV